MTVTLKSISLLLNALGTSPGILTFTASFNLEKAVNLSVFPFWVLFCCVWGSFFLFLFVWWGVYVFLVSSITCSRLLFCLLIIFFVASIFLHLFFFLLKSIFSQTGLKYKWKTSFLELQNLLPGVVSSSE